jgi:glycine/D-amino acid oxidase-like deaminating enzyme
VSELGAGDRQVVVVGAGPAGIASALALKDAGVSPLVVDRADQVASSWRGRGQSVDWVDVAPRAPMCGSLSWTSVNPGVVASRGIVRDLDHEAASRRLVP